MNYISRLRYYFTSNPTAYKSEFVLLFCSLVWGFSFPSVKLALNYMSPNAFIFFRFFITLSIFLAVYRKRIKTFKKVEVNRGIILGCFLFVGFLTQTVGLKYTSSANSAFITGTNLILIPIVQIVIIKIKPKFENIIGIIIVMFGIYILSDVQNTQLNFGDFITMICSVAFAFHIVYLDKYSHISDTMPLIYGQYLAMTVLSFLSMLFFEHLWLGQFKFEYNNFLLFSVVFNGIFSTFIALFLAMRFQKYTTPVRAGLIYNMEQVFAVIFAFFLISEMLSKNQIIGAFIILGGLLFSEFYSEIKRRFSVRI
ncbi:MAG: DMT family transporter [Ignavibacteriae bacterium]|nr:DMT family transporter [Ignavibacteriota bacterium]